MSYIATSATVTKDGTVVTINTGDDVSTIEDKSLLAFNGQTIVTIVKAYTDSSGNQFIQLALPWPYATQTNKPLIVVPTSADHAAATKEIRRVIDSLQVASTEEAVTGADGSKIMTPKSTKAALASHLDARMGDINAELENVRITHPYPWAMRKVEFEANRAQNNEMFAASGFVHFGKSIGGSTEGYSTVSEGLWTNETAENVLRLGRERGSGASHKDNPLLHIARNITSLDKLGGTGSLYGAEAKFPPAEDGTRTYDSATGASVTHTTSAIAFASETATNKVVTDRVDMWGFEAYLREVNDADPFVYASGLIQSRATDINGVPTVEDNVRPITYFAWYEGDEDSRGKGVNWQTAGEADRIKIASDPANNIYFDDETGKFYQWCIRGRSFAGAGNGDWNNVESGIGVNLSSNSGGLVPPQGTSNVGGFGSTWATTYGIYNKSKTLEDNSLGVFSPLLSSGHLSDRAVNGECYFLVCGTVNRLNQGAYHPSTNNSGSRLFGTGQRWHENQAGREISALQCFQGKYASSTISGRPDGRLANYIYSSGAGGVCRDMRYSAWGLKAEDFAEADLKVKSGEYRGRDALTTPLKLKAACSASSYALYFDGHIAPDYLKGKSNNKKVFIRLANAPAVTFRPDFQTLVTGEWVEALIIDHAGRPALTINGSDTSAISSGSAQTVQLDILIPDSVGGYRPNGVALSVADEYTHTEVIGDPANILQCPDLKDGWIGSWNPTIPASGSNIYPLTKKSVQSNVNRTHLPTAGDYTTWTSASFPVDPIENTLKTTVGDISAHGGVILLDYTTQAKMTEDSVNGEIYAGGVGQVDASSSSRLDRGSLLNYSLTGNIQTNASYLESNGSRFHSRPAILDYAISWELGVFTPAYSIIHQPLSLGMPSVGARTSCKNLNYNTAKNRQGFINYAYAELAYDDTAGDWGDDSKIHIVNNQTTMLDTNGNTVKVGTAQIVEPLGWIKNDK